MASASAAVPRTPSTTAAHAANANATTTTATTTTTTAPTELPDTTVKKYLESVCHGLCERLMDHARQQAKTLMDEFQAEKKLLLEEAEAERREARDAAANAAAGGANAGGGKRAKVNTARKVVFECVATPAALATNAADVKSEFVVTIQAGKPAKVGRSRGAAFIDGRGVSLNWDQEVSTTHGHLSLVDAPATENSSNNGDEQDALHVSFVDVGSTNGSKIFRKATNQTERLTEKVPVTLVVGDKLLLGATTLVLKSVVAV